MKKWKKRCPRNRRRRSVDAPPAGPPGWVLPPVRLMEARLGVFRGLGVYADTIGASLGASLDAIDASERAARLLERNLTPDQLAQWRRHKYFYVESRYQGFPYLWRVHQWPGIFGTYNLVLADDYDSPPLQYLGGPEREIHRGTCLCVYPRHPGEGIPAGDVLLGQKLTLESERGLDQLLATPGIGVRASWPGIGVTLAGYRVW